MPTSINASDRVRIESWANDPRRSTPCEESLLQEMRNSLRSKPILFEEEGLVIRGIEPVYQGFVLQAEWFNGPRHIKPENPSFQPLGWAEGFEYYYTPFTGLVHGQGRTGEFQLAVHLMDQSKLSGEAFRTLKTRLDLFMSLWYPKPARREPALRPKVTIFPSETLAAQQASQQASRYSYEIRMNVTSNQAEIHVEGVGVILLDLDELQPSQRQEDYLQSIIADHIHFGPSRVPEVQEMRFAEMVNIPLVGTGGSRGSMTAPAATTHVVTPTVDRGRRMVILMMLGSPSPEYVPFEAFYGNHPNQVIADVGRDMVSRLRSGRMVDVYPNFHVRMPPEPPVNGAFNMPTYGREIRPTMQFQGTYEAEL